MKNLADTRPANRRGKIMVKLRTLILIAPALLAFNVAPVANANPLVSLWTWRNPLPTANPLNGVTYGGGVFVAVGDYSTILTSVDGINWEQQTAPSNTSLTGVAYAATSPDLTGPVFVAVGADAYTGKTNVILTSPDGTNWTMVSQEPSLGTNGLLACAFGDNIFSAVGNDGVTLYWSDQNPWIPGNIVDGGDTSLAGVAFGMVSGSPGFVAVGGGGYVATSQDGDAWTPAVSSPLNTGLTSIAYGGGTWVALGSEGCFYSTDGTDWTATGSTDPSANFFGSGVTYGGGMFVAVGSDSESIITSTDGMTWTSSDGPSGNSVAYGGSTLVEVGGENTTTSLEYSNSVTGAWTAVSTNLTAGYLKTVACGSIGNGTTLFVAGGGSYSTSFPVVVTGTNGFDWQVDTSPSISPQGFGNFSSPLYTAFIDGLTYGTTSTGSNLFAASLNAEAGYTKYTSYIYCSTNGTFWTSNYGFGSQGSGMVLNAIAYGVVNGSPQFVAVGGSYESGASATSSDLVNWTSASGIAPHELYAVTYGVPNNGLSPRFVAVGASGTTACSTDGMTWTTSNDGDPNENYLEGVAYGNGVFVAVGENGSVYYSTTGSGSWMPATITSPYLASYQELYLVSITFADGLFVAATSGDGGSPYGEGGSLFISQDGMNWTETFPPTGEGFNGVGYGDGQFIAVGGEGTIMGSILPAPSNPMLVQNMMEFQVCGPPGKYGLYGSTDLSTWTLVEDETFTSDAPCVNVVIDVSNQGYGYYALGPP
jgi:hypothetical protein